MRAPRLITSMTLVTLPLVAVPVLADEPDAGAPPVVISATRTATPEDQLASSVTVITGEQIEQQQERTLPEVLKQVPGLNVVQTGGPGGQTSVFMRGTNSNHTKVFVDGIDVSDPSDSGASFDFAHLLTQDIARIEILRGPQSGLYGSDAIGGVINIITREGAGPASLTAAVEGGSFDTFNQAASLRGSNDQFRYSTTVEHFHAGATPVTPLGLLQPGEQRNDDYYDNLTGSTKLGYSLTSTLDLGLVARYTNTHLRDTGDDFSDFPNPAFPAAQQSAGNTSEGYGRVFGHLSLLDGAFDQTLGVAYTHKRTASYEPFSPVTLATGERTKIDWQGNIKLPAQQTVVLGAEHSRDEISEPLSASTRITAGYAELQSQFAERLFSALNVRYDDNSRFGSKVTYRVAPAFLVSETGTKFKASLGTGFKAPTLSELFQDFPPFFFANPDLKPETNIGYDLGVEQSALHDMLRVGVTWFHNHLRDLITTDDTGTSYANIGRATTEGVESFIAIQPAPTLSLRADYTYTQATDDILHQELLRRPRHKGTLTASWQAFTGLHLDATVLSVSSWVDGNRDFSIPRLDAQPYTTVNLAASYDLTSRLNLFAHLDNLLDRRYENPVGFLQPGLGAFAGLKLKL